MIKRLMRKILPNPFDQLIKKSKRSSHNSFLVVWNRGLGDVPLGLYALVSRLREIIPTAKITFLTRTDLVDAFNMLENVEVIASFEMKRKQSYNLSNVLENLGYKKSDWDVVIDSPDPTYWFKWQLGNLVPRLSWNNNFDGLIENFFLDAKEKYVGVHVQTQTSYGYEKNWPLERFVELFKKLNDEYRRKIILFGFDSSNEVSAPWIIDLRGKTSLMQMLSIIKNRCDTLIVPDSGVLSLTYYLDCQFPLHIVSLWADPFQGVLKQNVASPNFLLKHSALIAPNRDLKNIQVEDLLEALQN